MEKKRYFGKAEIVFILLYFVILCAERVQSIVRVISGGILFASPFDIYVNLLTLCSLGATAALAICFGKSLLSSPFRLSLTAGVLLLSGMVHTEFTVAPVQFASYGALIVAIIIRTAVSSRGAASRFKMWYSLAYLVSFSMAIPVMYRSAMEYHALFHALEAVTAATLVAVFTLLMYRVFKMDAEDLLLPQAFIIMAVLDAAVIGLRWCEEINMFALIFAALTAVMFIVGKIAFAIVGKKVEVRQNNII